MKFNITKKDNQITISSSKKLHTISDFTHSGGFDTVSDIILTKADISDLNSNSIAHTTNHLDYFEKTFKDLTIFTFTSCDVFLQDFEDTLKVLNSPKGFQDAKIDISNIVYINRALSKRDLVKAFKLINASKSRFFTNLNLPVHIQNILNTDDFLCVMCNCEGGDDLDFEITEAFEITLEEAFKKLDLTCGILDYLVSEGIQISELVESAVTYVDNFTDGIKDKIHSEIVKNLSDIDVIAILMAAVRIDSDISEGHIREINSYDDLYGDKAFAVSLANLIGGGKAILRLNRYLTYKPGVLYFLPSVFTGLVVGCVTKVLEEY